MSRKNIITPFKIFDAVDISTNQTQSTPTNTSRLDKASITLNWTGTAPVGTITVEARNGSDDVWHELDFGSAISISGNTGSHELIFNELPFEEIRVLYTAGSGTGTLDAILVAKVVGA